MEPLMNLKELSEYLRVPKSTIYDKVYHKEIPYIKLGKSLRFKKELIDRWIEERSQPPITV